MEIISLWKNIIEMSLTFNLLLNYYNIFSSSRLISVSILVPSLVDVEAGLVFWLK